MQTIDVLNYLIENRIAWKYVFEEIVNNTAQKHFTASIKYPHTFFVCSTEGHWADKPEYRNDRSVENVLFSSIAWDVSTSGLVSACRRRFLMITVYICLCLFVQPSHWQTYGTVNPKIVINLVQSNYVSLSTREENISVELNTLGNGHLAS